MSVFRSLVRSFARSIHRHAPVVSCRLRTQEARRSRKALVKSREAMAATTRINKSCAPLETFLANKRLAR